MAKYSRDDYLKAIQSLVGDRSDDDTLEIIGNLTDTYDGLHDNSNENWKQKYEDNDKEWRKKYKERFFGGGTGNDDDEPPQAEPPKKHYSFADLFKEGE